MTDTLKKVLLGIAVGALLAVFYQHIAGERGTTWETIRGQRERETSDLIQRAKRIAEAEQVPVDVALALIQQQNPNQQIATKEQESSTQPPEEEQQ